MFENGIDIVKVDFHMHTNGDKEFKYVGDPEYYISEYIQQLVDNEISIGIITNHNKFVKEEYDKLRKTGKRKGCCILPGVELSVKEGANGVHTLIVFKPEDWLCNGTNNIEIFLNEVFRDTPNRENENTRCKYDLPGVMEILERYNSDFFIVFAHVEQPSGIIHECNGGLIKTLAAYPWFRRRVLGIQKVRTRDDIKKFEEHLGYKLPYLEGSDCKNIKAIGKGNSVTFVKLGALSFDALKFALRAGTERLYAEKTEPGHSYIKQIDFQGGILNGCSIGLSANLNTFIGIRGSGKSAVIEVLRYVLSLPATVDSEYKNELVKYVLGSGGVAIVHVVDKYGKEYQVKRIFGENTYVFDLDGNNLGIDCSSIISNPVYFGQGDLALTKAGYEFELLHKLVKPDENYEIRLTECLSSIKTKIGEWMELESLPTQIEDIQSKIRDINHKLKIFEEHGVAAKLAKQTGYATDLTEAKSVIANSNDISKRLHGICDYFRGIRNSKSYFDEIPNRGHKLFIKKNRPSPWINGYDCVMEQIELLSERLEVDGEHLEKRVADYCDKIPDTVQLIKLGRNWWGCRVVCENPNRSFLRVLYKDWYNHKFDWEEAELGRIVLSASEPYCLLITPQLWTYNNGYLLNPPESFISSSSVEQKKQIHDILFEGVDDTETVLAGGIIDYTHKEEIFGFMVSYFSIPGLPSKYAAHCYERNSRLLLQSRPDFSEQEHYNITLHHNGIESFQGSNIMCGFSKISLDEFHWHINITVNGMRLFNEGGQEIGRFEYYYGQRGNMGNRYISNQPLLQRWVVSKDAISKARCIVGCPNNIKINHAFDSVIRKYED